MATKIQLRRDTAADWTSGNPTLAAGEFAWESDTNRYKIGDGATAWNSLGYADTLSTLGDLSVTGSTISSPSNADLTLTTSGTGDIVLDALRVNGTTLDSSDSSKITIAEALDVTGAVTITSGTITGITDLTVADGGTGASTLTDNAVLTGTGTSAITAEGNLSFDGSTLAVTGAATVSTTLGVTGASTLDGVTVTDNTISSNDSNANLEINANGTGTVNLENLKIGTSGSTVTTILDEDNLASDSATALATQQSIKAYVDTQIATEDTIAELNDTTITGTPADNEVLAYDSSSSKWINQTPAEASLVSLTGSETLTNKTLASPTFTTNFTIGSATITEAELEILDGANVTTAELNIMDGDTGASSVTLADADRLVVNDNGTMKQVAVTDMTTYIGDPIAMAIALG